MENSFHSKDVVVFKQNLTPGDVIKSIKATGLREFSIVDFNPIPIGTEAIVETVVAEKYIRLHKLSVGRLLCDQSPDEIEIYIDSRQLELSKSGPFHVSDSNDSFQQHAL